MSPAPGGKDFLQAYNCQAGGWTVAHQVIVAAQGHSTRLRISNRLLAMMEETIDRRRCSRAPGKYPRYRCSADTPAKAVDELYALGVDPFVAPEQTRHGRVVPSAPRGRIPSHLSPRDRMRRKLQTKRGRQRISRFGLGVANVWLRQATQVKTPVAYPIGGSDDLRAIPNQLLPGQRRPASGTGEGERRMVADLHRPQPAQTVPLWGQSAQESTGRWASPTRQELLPRGSEHGAIRKAIWGPAGATGKISCRDPLSLTRKHR